MKAVLVFLISYLLGSIPIGYLVSRYLNNVDIRQHGSGNTGATNVYRILGLKAGLITAIGDIGKAIIAIKIVERLILTAHWGLELKTILLISGIIVIIGHNWSIFLRFDGGKGVATTVGVLLALLPYSLLILTVIWISIVYFTRYVSLASIISGLTLPLLLVLFKEPSEYIIFGIAAALFVIYRHRSNIQRLLKGEENQIRSKANDKSKRVR